MVQFHRLDKNLGTKSANSNITTSQHSLSPKNLQSSHKTTSIFLRTKHIPYPIQNPQKHHAWIATHPLPCVGPYKNTWNNFRPFLDILSTMEVFS